MTPRTDDTTALFAERYRAIESRDARFDGQFITGVHSTGIYCRPSCPALDAEAGERRRSTCTAAAAHEAGLRACKRCLPDAVPGSPEWNLRGDLAARAMRLIADGVVERDGVPGPRRAPRLHAAAHLTRVLTAELGAGPLALARAHRAQTARDAARDHGAADRATSRSPPGSAACASSTTRSRAVYQQTRRARSSSERARPASASTLSPRPPRPSRAPAVSLRLPARAPFDGAGRVRFLAVARRHRSRELRPTAYYRPPLRLPGGVATISLRVRPAHPPPRSIAAMRPRELSDLAPARRASCAAFDLDADADAIDSALAADPALAPAVAAVPGIRVAWQHEPGGDPVPGTHRAADLGRCRSHDARPPGRRPRRRCRSARRLAAVPDGRADRRGGRAVLRGPAARIDTIMRVAEALASGELHLDVGESTEDSPPAQLRCPASARGPPATSRCAFSAAPMCC